MAIYHLSVKSVSRSQGHSATAAAAYRAGVRLACERTGIQHDYTRRRGVEHSEVIVPDAAIWARDRAVLWNRAEADEVRKNSVVAREYELALPHELSAASRVELVRQFGVWIAQRYEVAVDFAIHAPHRAKAQDGEDNKNWHAHVLTTTRIATAQGLGPKTRVLDAQTTRGQEVEAIRAKWADLTNSFLEAAGVEASVDHRSLIRQQEEAEEAARRYRAEGAPLIAEILEAHAVSLNRPVEPHRGKAATAMERRAEEWAHDVEGEYRPVTRLGQQTAEAHSFRLAADSMLALAYEKLKSYAQAYIAEWAKATRGLIATFRQRARAIQENDPKSVIQEIASLADVSPDQKSQHDFGAMRHQLTELIRRQRIGAKLREQLEQGRKRKISISRN